MDSGTPVHGLCPANANGRQPGERLFRLHPWRGHGRTPWPREGMLAGMDNPACHAQGHCRNYPAGMPCGTPPRVVGRLGVHTGGHGLCGVLLPLHHPVLPHSHGRRTRPALLRHRTGRLYLLLPKSPVLHHRGSPGRMAPGPCPRPGNGLPAAGQQLPRPPHGRCRWQDHAGHHHRRAPHPGPVWRHRHRLRTPGRLRIVHACASSFRFQVSGFR